MTLARIEMLMVGPTRKEFLEMVSKLAIACPSQVTDERTWKARISLMHEDLCHFPADILDKACERLRFTKTFFPSIGEIASIADTLLSERKRIIRRLEQLLRVADNPAPNGEASLDWYISIVGGGE